MKLVLLFILACSAYGSTQATDEELRGVVTEVIDGNTLLIVTLDKEQFKVLLHGIDSPEPGQHYAIQSKKRLEDLILNKTVTLFIHGKDRLGNRLVEIQIDGGLDPRHELVKAGLAWTSEKEPNPVLESLKEEARQKNLGLWNEPDPTPPWVYRRQQSMGEAKSS